MLAQLPPIKDDFVSNLRTTNHRAVSFKATSLSLTSSA